MLSVSSKQTVDWNEIEKLIKTLSRKILKSPRSFQSITTLSRGGIGSFTSTWQIIWELKKFYVDKHKINSDSLFVDDIFDTGTSFEKVLSKVDDASKLFFVTLFARRGKKYPRQLVYAKKTN